MTMIGNQNAFVGLTIDLRTIGPVPVIVGQGICGLVGTSTRGPANIANPLGIPSDAVTQYYSGDLKEAIETAFSQGCPVIYAVRVLGKNCWTADYDVMDEVATPNFVGSISAYSEGAWGNSVVVRIEDGSFSSTDVEIIPGDGTVGPYALQVWNLDTNNQTSNYVKVNGVKKNITYEESGLAAGYVWVNSLEGTIKFYVNEAPSSSDLIEVGARFLTKRIIVTDNERLETYDNIKSLTALKAAFDKSNLVRFEIAPDMTHLPMNEVFTLQGGSDGEQITTDDWLQALELLGNTIAPTTVAITSHSIDTEAATYDLLPVFDGWLAWMANIFKPCQGFVAVQPGESVSTLLNLAANFNNKWLSIEGNGWDNSSVPRNLAVARAAKEAAVSLGTSCAEAQNSMNGVSGLLYQFNQDETDALTRGGVDVIVKQRGIKPYVGITTATDWQFMRTVDMRTVNWVIVALNYIAQQYYFKRRTPQVMAALQASIEAVLEEQVTLQNVEAYAVSVYPNSTDTNRVDIDLLLQNIGHIERIRTVMSVGIITT
jgi:hypothetical protein